MLLHASMQVALDSATVGVRGQDQPLPRRAQLGDLGTQSLECLSEPFVLVGSHVIDLQSVREVLRDRTGGVKRRTSSCARRAASQGIHVLAR